MICNPCVFVYARSDQHSVTVEESVHTAAGRRPGRQSCSRGLPVCADASCWRCSSLPHWWVHATAEWYVAASGLSASVSTRILINWLIGWSIKNCLSNIPLSHTKQPCNHRRKERKENFQKTSWLVFLVLTSVSWRPQNGHSHVTSLHASNANTSKPFECWVNCFLGDYSLFSKMVWLQLHFLLSSLLFFQPPLFPLSSCSQTHTHMVLANLSRGPGSLPASPRTRHITRCHFLCSQYELPVFSQDPSGRLPYCV